MVKSIRSNKRENIEVGARSWLHRHKRWMGEGQGGKGRGLEIWGFGGYCRALSPIWRPANRFRSCRLSIIPWRDSISRPFLGVHQRMNVSIDSISCGELMEGGDKGGEEEEEEEGNEHIFTLLFSTVSLKETAVQSLASIKPMDGVRTMAFSCPFRLNARQDIMIIRIVSTSEWIF